ncbi:MAG: hypothetical protein IK074_05820 [Bacteroidales bacterium]|nr:hypothetical protein [Bacteroidales bacterium]
MKKLTSILLALTLTFWVVGCGISCRTISVSTTASIDRIQQRGTVLIGTTGGPRHSWISRSPASGSYLENWLRIFD